jgi:hypothetical protein
MRFLRGAVNHIRELTRFSSIFLTDDGIKLSGYYQRRAGAPPSTWSTSPLT